MSSQIDGQTTGRWENSLTRIKNSQSLEIAHLVLIRPALPLEVNLKCHNTNSICLSERKTEANGLELIAGAGTCTSHV